MQKGEKRKAEILQASSELFAQKGYRKTTLQDILDSVKCSKGSFYHHFESKLQVLEALALEHTQQDYQDFRSTSPETLLGELNHLLYFSCPFRLQEVHYTAALLGLGIRQEGAVIAAHIREARKTAFFDDLKALLRRMKEEGLAYFSNESLPELLWDTHMVFCDTLLLENCRLIISGATPGSRMLQMLQAARFVWERLLDLPFGCIDIIGADELIQTLVEASAIIRMEQEQLRFDTLK